MLTIRLIRTGKRNKSSFRVILTEKTSPPKSGKFLEVLGNYNPHQKEINLKEERIKHWLSKGAQASDTVHNLLVKQGVVKGPKIKKKIKSKKKLVKEEKEKPKKVDKSEKKE
ncbi:MAG: 30S ribosomal protein S16 [Parcubacteria group bacterium]|nr:30S ribosomal protein S16 [Parcubacteria group bacterium]